MFCFCFCFCALVFLLRVCACFPFFVFFFVSSGCVGLQCLVDIAPGRCRRFGRTREQSSAGAKDRSTQTQKMITNPDEMLRFRKTNVVLMSGFQVINFHGEHVENCSKSRFLTNVGIRENVTLSVTIPDIYCVR